MLTPHTNVPALVPWNHFSLRLAFRSFVSPQPPPFFVFPCLSDVPSAQEELVSHKTQSHALLFLFFFLPTPGICLHISLIQSSFILRFLFYHLFFSSLLPCVLFTSCRLIFTLLFFHPSAFFIFLLILISPSPCPPSPYYRHPS